MYECTSDRYVYICTNLYIKYTDVCVCTNVPVLRYDSLCLLGFFLLLYVDSLCLLHVSTPTHVVDTENLHITKESVCDIFFVSTACVGVDTCSRHKESIYNEESIYYRHFLCDYYIQAQSCMSLCVHSTRAQSDSFFHYI